MAGAKSKKDPLVSHLKVSTQLFNAIIEAAKHRGVTTDELLSVALRSITERTNTMLLDSKFRFGKYKGMPLEQIIRCDPRYVEWCLLNVDRFTISDEAMDLLGGIDEIPF